MYWSTGTNEFTMRMKSENLCCRMAYFLTTGRLYKCTDIHVRSENTGINDRRNNWCPKKKDIHSYLFSRICLVSRTCSISRHRQKIDTIKRTFICESYNSFNSNDLNSAITLKKNYLCNAGNSHIQI